MESTISCGSSQTQDFCNGSFLVFTDVRFKSLFLFKSVSCYIYKSVNFYPLPQFIVDIYGRFKFQCAHTSFA